MPFRLAGKIVTTPDPHRIDPDDVTNEYMLHLILASGNVEAANRLDTYTYKIDRRVYRALLVAELGALTNMPGWRWTKKSPKKASTAQINLLVDRYLTFIAPRIMIRPDQLREEASALMLAAAKDKLTGKQVVERMLDELQASPEEYQKFKITKKPAAVQQALW
jgi:hypothetical protein